jgi:hypothetical protein
MAQKILRDYRSLWEAWEGDEKAEELEIIVEYLDTLLEDLEYGLIDIDPASTPRLREVIERCKVQLEGAKNIFENN